MATRLEVGEQAIEVRLAVVAEVLGDGRSRLDERLHALVLGVEQAQRVGLEAGALQFGQVVGRGRGSRSLRASM